VIVAVFEREDAARHALNRIGGRWPAVLESGTPLEHSGEEQRLGRIIAGAAAAGAVAGAAIAVAVQWWTATIAYPLDIGGRPSPAWGSYVPAAIALAMLWSAVAAFVAFLVASGLPRLHHPFLASEARDALYRGCVLLSVACPEEEHGEAEVLIGEARPSSIVVVEE